MRLKHNKAVRVHKAENSASTSAGEQDSECFGYHIDHPTWEQAQNTGSSIILPASAGEW